MVNARRYWITVALLLALWLATAWGWRETWVRARWEARIQQMRLEEEFARSSLKGDQIDELMIKFGLPKWWKNWSPPKQEAKR